MVGVMIWDLKGEGNNSYEDRKADVWLKKKKSVLDQAETEGYQEEF